MGETNNIPSIRFEGFTEAWEQRKLGEICERVTRKNKNNESNLPLTIASQFGLIDQRDFFNKVVAAKDMSNYYLLKKGEFAYNKSYSNGFDYGSIKRLNAYEQGCLSTLYICFGITSDEVESDYLECFFDTLKWYRDVSMICAEGARNHGLLNVDTKGFFDEVTIDLPKSLEEQKKISAYLNALDNLVTLHQRKYDKLVILKKSMLEKMFPKNGSNVPEIRFEGFTEAWEQRKLSSICSMHARIGWQNLRTSEFLDSGEYYLVTGTDFDDGRVNWNTCHYVERERYDQDKKIQIKNGSILITKDGTLGKVAFIEGLDKPATLNAGVFNVEIIDNNVDNKYLFQYLKAPFLMDYVDKKATGGTIKHLNQNILVDFPVWLTDVNEQRLIGEYFQRLDNLITLHLRKPCKIGKIGYNDWEQRKLEDMCSIITKQTGFDYSETIKPALVTEKRDDTYSFIQNKDFDGENINLDTDFYIPIKVAERFPKITLDTPSLLISISGKIGNVGYYRLKDKAFIGGAVGICKLKKDIGTMLVYALQSDAGQAYFYSLIKASSHANITVEDIRNITITLPKSDTECEKVAAYFSRLDNLITLHQRKLQNRVKNAVNVWKQRKLEDLCSIITKQTGFDYSETIKPALVTEKRDDTYLFIQNKDFDGENINLDTDFYIPIKVDECFPKITLDTPSLLISISGKIGNVGYCRLKNKAFIGGAVGICKLKKDIGTMLVYDLQSEAGQAYFYSLIKALSHANIMVEDIRNITITLPKSDIECERVATYFSRLDNLTENEEGSQVNQQKMKASLDEYNKMFETKFELSQIQGYNINLNNRLARKEAKYKSRSEQLDLVIVVDRLLTGFDASCLSTLFIDRQPMGPHDLIQAFSRTNHIFDKNKTYGQIVTFQAPKLFKESVDNAIKLYSDGGTKEALLADWEGIEEAFKIALALRVSAATHYRNGEIPNESAIKATVDFSSYKQTAENVLPKFKYFTKMMESLKKTLDDEIKPLLNQ